ncbi:MAG TPA: right-handed parallel beta-helix repeat-containing protein [bacterium]|nr:right-handed parallel beta-helix repeat-containing protein [bacterium]
MAKEALVSLIVLVLVQVALAQGLVGASEYYVDINAGSNSNSGRSESDAWRTISFALDSVQQEASASNPVTICIAQGTYSPAAGELFGLVMRDYVSLKGAGGDFKTILDAQGIDRVIYCIIARQVTISDVVIMNGKTEGDGAGIFALCSSPIVERCTFIRNRIVKAGGSGAGLSGISEDCRPVILDCNFIANRSEAYGGAIASGKVTVVDCLFDSNEAGEDGGAVEVCFGEGLIEGCTFMGNTASMGGAVHCYGGESMVVRRCVMTGNAAYDGGGILFNNVENALIEDCRILHNTAQHNGGGILLNESSPVIKNCLIAQNQTARFGGGVQLSSAAPEIRCTTVADNRAGVEGDGLCCAFGGRAIIVDSILWGNRDNELMLATASFSDIQDQLMDGPGNISADPLYVLGEGCDYLLSQAAAGQASESPCIDAGSDSASTLGMAFYSTRTDNVSDTGIVDMGYHVPVAMPRVHAWPDAESYVLGGCLRPIVAASNDGLPVFVDVCAGFVGPAGEVICLTNHGATLGLAPWVSDLVLEHGFSFGPTVLMKLEIPYNLPAGEYMFFIALFSPGTTDPIGYPASFRFAVASQLDH